MIYVCPEIPLTESFIGPIFGVPAEDDPDPFGVKALEAEGLNIREAGTHQRPSAAAFEFKPSPTSPIYTHFSRQSVDGSIRSRTWRDSTHSLASVDRGTQTDEDESKSAGHSPKRRDSTALKDSTKVVESPQKHSQLVEDEDEQHMGRRESFSDVDSDAEIQTAVPVVTRARVVEVPRRLPPALPPRNPERVTSPVDTQAASDGFDKISLNGLEGETKHEGERRLSQTGTNEATDSTFHSVPVTPIDEKKSNDIPGSFQ
jgi:hypothetical protein